MLLQPVVTGPHSTGWDHPGESLHVTAILLLVHVLVLCITIFLLYKWHAIFADITCTLLSLRLILHVVKADIALSTRVHKKNAPP